MAVIAGRTLPGLALLILVAACVAQPDPVNPTGPPSLPSSDAPTASQRAPSPGSARPASLLPAVTPTPLPPIEQRSAGVVAIGGGPDDLEPGLRRAAVEDDGVRVEIEADAVPLVGGRATWVTTRLTNTGRDVLRWITDGCSIDVGVVGEMELRWAPGFEQAGPAKTFKDWLITAHDIPSPDDQIWLRFVPKPFVGIGDFACADVGIGHELAPGDHVVERHRWDGTTGAFGRTPSGPAVLTATFRSWWRRARVGDTRPPIVTRLLVDVRGDRDVRTLSPGQAIDVAVAEPAFRALLDAHPRIAEWHRIVVTHDRHRDEWLVGVRTERAGAWVGIDASTGAIVWAKHEPDS